MISNDDGKPACSNEGKYSKYSKVNIDTTEQQNRRNNRTTEERGMRSEVS